MSASKKLLFIAGIIGATVIAYLFLTIVMPILADFASSANTTISTSSNISDYPGTQEALLGAPLLLYFVPAVFAVILVVIVLRSR